MIASTTAFNQARVLCNQEVNSMKYESSQGISPMALITNSSLKIFTTLFVVISN